MREEDKVKVAYEGNNRGKAEEKAFAKDAGKSKAIKPARR